MSSSNMEERIYKKQTAKRVKTTTSKRLWSKKEDAMLVECLHILAEDPHWKADNGTFRTGYLSQLEKLLESKLPTAQLKANLHIESRVKLLKRQYNAISKMLSIGSGFGWNEKEKCVTAPKDVFDDWVRSHPTASGLRNKSFPHFDDFVQIFGKDRATGAGVETPADAVKELDAEEDEFVDTPDTETNVGKDSESRDDIGASTCQTTAAASNKKAVTSKKRSRGTDGLSELVEEIGKFGTAYQEAAQEIKGISSFFKKEAEGTDRRMKIFTEIMEIEGLSKDDMLTAGEYISKDTHKVDFFFSLPKEFKRDYILKQLNECNRYRPSFYFNPSADM